MEKDGDETRLEPQVPGWLMRWPGWHVVAQLSHDGYVTEYSTQGLCNVGIAN